MILTTQQSLANSEERNPMQNKYALAKVRGFSGLGYHMIFDCFSEGLLRVFMLSVDLVWKQSWSVCSDHLKS